LAEKDRQIGMAVSAPGMTAESTADETARIARLVLLIVLVGTAVRLVLGGTVGLGMDESYSVGSARQFMPSYVDHPPLHYWAAGLAMRLFGSEAPIVVRLPAILFFAGSSWLMFRLAGRLFGARAGLWAVAGFNIAPVFTLAHASWVLPDGPAIFFMLAAANVVAPILLDDPAVRRVTLRWLAAGALGGLAMLSKYTGIFVFVGVLAFVLTVRPAWRHLMTPGPWLAVALALVVFSPVIAWNLEHGFIGFGFQTRRLPGSESIHPLWLLQFIGGQALYLSPLLFWPFLVALYRGLRGGPKDRGAWLIALIAIGPVGLFTIISLFAHSQPHWPMPGWVFAIVLFGRDAAKLAAERPRFARGYMAVSAAFVFVVLAVLVWQAKLGGIIPASLGAKADPTVDLLEWRELRPELEARGLLGPDAVVAAPIWMYAGKASHALGPDIPVVCACGDPQQFRYRYDQTQWNGRDMPVVWVQGDTRVGESARAFFDRLDPLPPITIMRAGRPALVLDVAMGRNLHMP